MLSSLHDDAGQATKPFTRYSKGNSASKVSIERREWRRTENRGDVGLDGRFHR